MSQPLRLAVQVVSPPLNLAIRLPITAGNAQAALLVSLQGKKGKVSEEGADVNRAQISIHYNFILADG